MDSERPVLKDTGSGYTIKYKGKYLYSSLQPKALVKKRVDRITLSEKTLIFIPSFCLGYGINALLEKLPNSSHILCVEVDEILLRFACNQQVVPIPSHDRLTIVRTEDAGELIRLVRGIGTWKFRRVEMCILSGGIHLFKEKYEAMFHCIEEEIQQYWKNKMTFIHMAPLWIRNIFFNLSIIDTFLDISTIKTGTPIIVAGAGPSLEGSIAEIKKVRKKIILLAVDTAFPYFYQLWQHGEQDLLPDFIFILESQVANINDFVTCKNPGVPLICDITSHPGVIRLFKNKKYLFTSHFSEIKLLGRMKDAGLLPTEFPALGSVGVAALYAALHLTTGPVFLAGLDFGYSKNMTHCRGTAHYQFFESASYMFSPLESLVYKSIRSRPLIRQKGKQGNIVLTDLILSAYAAQIPGMVKNRVGVYDIGTYGLDLGLPGLGPGTISSFVNSKEKFKRIGNGKKSEFIPPRPGGVKDFLIKEKEYLSGCRELITPLVSGHKIKDSFTHKEHEALLNVDYTYLHFPDQVSLPVCERNFLFRTLVSLEHYETVLDRALRLLDR